MSPASVLCPTCRKTVQWIPEHVFRPFCSERCKQIDLGQWASEAYRTPVLDDVHRHDLEAE